MAELDELHANDAPVRHPAKTDMTVPEMREWLRTWVGKAVGKSPDSIDESVPMVELGLSSRDAVAMAADIEDLTGVTLSVAVAFQHPTIESLATRIIEGEPETSTSADDDVDWSRTGPARAGRHRGGGFVHPFPRRHEQPEGDLAGAAGRP